MQLPWLEGQGLEGTPASMALEWLSQLEVILRFLWDPAVCPEWFFQWILEPFCPFDLQRWMALVVVPGA